MAPLTPDAFASRIIDACAASDIVEDYDLQIHENVVIRSRIRLLYGFIDVYKNFETGTTAYAWIADETRRFGADNTGGLDHGHRPTMGLSTTSTWCNGARTRVPARVDRHGSPPGPPVQVPPPSR